MDTLNLITLYGANISTAAVFSSSDVPYKYYDNIADFFTNNNINNINRGTYEIYVYMLAAGIMGAKNIFPGAPPNTFDPNYTLPQNATAGVDRHDPGVTVVPAVLRTVIPQTNSIAVVPANNAYGANRINTTLYGTTVHDQYRDVQSMLIKIGGYIRILFNLCQCYKVTALNKDNVDGYLKELKSDSDKQFVLELVKSIHKEIPTATGNADFKLAIKASTFLTYHTSYSSSAALVDRFLTDVGTLVTVSQAEKLKIDHSKNSPWDPALNRGMKKKLIGYAAIWFQLVDPEMTNWYQGKREMKKISNMERIKCQEVFRKFIQINTDTGAINTATNTAALAGIININVQ